MSVIFEVAIIFSISFAGECLHAWLPLPVPASVYGFFLLLAGLVTKVIKLRQVEKAGLFFVSLLPLVFVPALVGLLGVPALSASVLWVIGLLAIVSTIVIMGITGRITQRCLTKGRRGV